MLVRYVISSGLGLGITFGLFLLMQTLVAMGEAQLDEGEHARVIDFVRVKKSAPVQEKERELPSRPKASNQPPSPSMDLPSPSVGGVSAAPMAIAAPSADMPIRMRKGPKLGPAPVSDRDETPLVRVNPQYPMRARQDSIEGYTVAVFDVNPDGDIENVRVVDAQPRGVFERETIRAVQRWRYRPKVVNGKGVWRRGLRVRFPFRLND